MRTIALINSKGGAGKSTLVCALALHWAEKEKKRVGILDMDTRHLISEGFVLHIKHPNISLHEEGETYDIVLIDTAGAIEKEVLDQVVENSDLILIPFDLSPADVPAVLDTLALFDAPKKTRLMLNRIHVTDPEWKDRDTTMKAIPAKSLKSVIRYKASYKQALLKGWKGLHWTSRNELRNLAEEVS